MKPSPTLLRACGRGNQTACNLAKRIVALYAGSVISFSDAEKVKDHPNRMPFEGTLLIVDEPSTKPPHGAEQHRILVRKNTVKDKLDTLPGMAVNYEPEDLAEHKTRHKVGIITKAWLDGNEVKVSGFVWKKDFPEAERDLKKPNLGMSMELADVWVDNEKASVWDLSDFSFTGATILKRDAAAYNKTSLAASKDREEGEKRMAKDNKDKKKKVAAASNDDTGQRPKHEVLANAIGSAIKTTLTPLVEEIKASNQRVADEMEELRGLHLIQAAAQDDDDDEAVMVHAAGKDDDDDDDMAAARGEDSSEDDDDMAAGYDEDDDDDMAAARGDDDSDESSSASDDESSASDMDAALETLEKDHADQEPGQVNKDAANRGRKTTVTKPPRQGEKFAGNVAKGRLSSSADTRGGRVSRSLEAAAVEAIKHNKKLRRELKAMAATNAKTTKKLKTQIKAMSVQLERFADLEERRSAMPRELVNLGSKAGYDLRDIKANGQQLSLEAVDHMFAVAAQSGTLIEPEQRIAMKNLLTEQGLLGDCSIGQA